MSGLLWEVHKKRRNVNARMWCKHRGVTTYEQFEIALVKEKFVPPETRDEDVLKYIASLGPVKKEQPVLQNNPSSSRKTKRAKTTTKAKK